MAIIDFPSTGALCTATFGQAGFEFGFAENLKTYRSTLTSYTQTLTRPGGLWGCSITWPNVLRPDESAELEAFILSLRGGANRLRLWNLSREVPRGVATGVPVVDSTTTTAGVIGLKTAPASVTNYLRKGDMIGISNIGVNGQLFMVTADVNTTAGGLASVPVHTEQRAAPANGSAVVLSKPTALFIPASAEARWRREGAIMSGHRLDLIEVFA